MVALAQSLPSSGWYRCWVSEGTKGPIEYEFARKRVTLCKDDLPDRTVWLVIKRTRGANPTYAFSISNAPESAPLHLFVWLSGIRWAVEQSFEETKTELGWRTMKCAKGAFGHSDASRSRCWYRTNT